MRFLDVWRFSKIEAEVHIILGLAEALGRTHNPLFICDDIGLGKTHLLHAIAHYALSRDASLKIIYLNAEKFINIFVQALKGGQLSQIREEANSTDMFLIDDIQFLCNRNRSGSQEELSHIFDTLRSKDRQIVISSNHRPSKLKLISEMLTKFFQSGLLVELQVPDESMRIEIIRKKAALMNCNVPDDVIHFIAQNITSNIRDLEGGLKRIIMAHKISNKLKVTYNTTRRELGPILQRF